MPTLLEVFFDSGCPFCSGEVALLRRLDRHDSIRFTDIDAPDFDPAPLGLTMEQLMGSIHARLPDGRFIDGVEVFRQIYASLRLGPLTLSPLIALSRLPGISHTLDAGYRLFARNRLWLGDLTGKQRTCADGICRRPDHAPRHRIDTAPAGGS